MTATAIAVETAARASYGRLLAFVAARAGGDVEAAEDALAEAFVAALAQWPRDGVPEKSEAWLLATARRRLVDQQRRYLRHSEKMNALQSALDAARTATCGDDFPDERLKLLFVCAHPAIDPAARTPLMLQAVLGLDAERIAAVFLTSPAAMGQRLVRAKGKIRDAGIPFRVPHAGEWPERVSFVLDAIYAAYTTGSDDASGTPDLAEESIWLIRVFVRLLPDEPEALGLLALLLHCHARRAARQRDGCYIPLQDQDPALWDHSFIEQAETALALAARRQSPGRFQLEAAIQSVHAQRARSGATDWLAICRLYQSLVLHTPALGARLGQVVAVSKSEGPAAALVLLDQLPLDALINHQPYWATRAHLLHEMNRTAAARAAYQRAIGLTEDAAARAFLTARMPS